LRAGDRVPVAVQNDDDAGKDLKEFGGLLGLGGTIDSDADKAGVTSGAASAQEMIITFKCQKLQALLEKLRPQQGEYEFDTTKGKATEMIGKFVSDRKGRAKT
jgi:hypothetical protein